VERFLPGRHPIDAFGNGGFRLGGVSHTGSLLITPSGARALPAVSLDALTVEMLAPLLAEAADIDMLLIGSGPNIHPAPKHVRELLSAAGLAFDVMDTHAAVRTYNVVVDEARRVACIMLAVDHARA
jgi:uncharacterized protein